MTEKERLVKEMRKQIYDHQGNSYITERDTKFALDLADWVIADRKRIVKPLVVIKQVDIDQGEWSGEDWYEKAIDEVLKLAGGE